jgi:hypothetical protein
VPDSPPIEAPLEPVVSDIQRERAEMLEAFEAPRNLSVTGFAKLAGKSRDQINRDIKARRLLALSLGNRGRRLPDWQLDPLRYKLTRLLLQQTENADMWIVYRSLSQPHERLQGHAPIEVVTLDNFHEVMKVVCTRLRGSETGNSLESLRVLFPAACGVSFMDERVSTQEPQCNGFALPFGLSGEVPPCSI